VLKQVVHTVTTELYRVKLVAKSLEGPGLV
jgi:hypothetical protein